VNSNGHLPIPRPGPECASFIDLLPLLSVGTLEKQEANRLHLHLATCAYCQTQRATYDRIDVVLRHSFGAQETFLFSPEQLMATIDQEQKDQEQQEPRIAPATPALPTPLRTHHPRQTRRVVSFISALAAVLVIAVVVTAIFASRGALPRGTTGHPKPVAATNTLVPTATPQESAYVPNPDGDLLSSVQMLSPGEGWAVGGFYQAATATTPSVSGALILHYSSGQWRRARAPSNQEIGLRDAEIQSVAMVSTDEGWAVGSGNFDGSIPSAFILHYSAGKWTTWSTISDAELWSVQMLSPTDGWASGGGGWGTDQGATTSILLHYNGTKWNPVQVPSVDGITSLDMLSADNGWATGTDTILHYDGKQWSIFQHLQGVYGLSMDSPTDGWAIGFLNFPYNHTSSSNEVWHYTGSRWVQGSLPNTVDSNAQILALSMDSVSDGWAVGYGNGDKGQARYALYLHYTNGQWVQVQGPGKDNINSVTMLSADEGWAVGNGGVVMHYLNGAWTQYQF
jgi:hypothetical protein